MTKRKKRKANYCIGSGRVLIDGREIGNTRKKFFWVDGVLYFEVFADDMQNILFQLLTDRARSHEVQFIPAMATGKFPALQFTGIVKSKKMKLHGSDWLGLRVTFRVEGNTLNSSAWR